MRLKRLAAGALAAVMIAGAALPQDFINISASAEESAYSDAFLNAIKEIN